MRHTYRPLRNGPARTRSRVIRIPAAIACTIPDATRFTVRKDEHGRLVYTPVRK